MTSSLFSTFPLLSSIFPLSSPCRQNASTTTLRSTQRTIGLFDKGFPGDLSSANNVKVEGDLDTIDPDDLLSVLEPGFEEDENEALLGERQRRSTGSSISSMHAGTTSMFLDDLDDPTDTDFLEVFTNLHDLLPSDDTKIDSNWLLGLPLEDSIEEPIPGGSKSLKRTADEAFTPTIVPPPNPDHNDYVCKIKRPRQSMASESSEAESVCSMGMPKTTKYLQRRTKNNIASRRSRETRKQKFVAMEGQAVHLEEANERLQRQVNDLEKLTKTMKDILIEKMSRSK